MTPDRAIKRAVDFLAAATLLLGLSPLLVLSSLVVLWEDGWPVIFRQERVGLRGRPFHLIKLRTMRRNTLPVSVVGQVGPDHAMVLRTGRWLRRFKLDELPQLLNVLVGEMSLVGPRPTVQEQVDHYTPYQRRRLEMPPGMTGWAQVNGGVSLSWSERILLDVWYVDRWSLALDLRILLATPAVVFRGERRSEPAVEQAREHAASG